MYRLEAKGVKVRFEFMREGCDDYIPPEEEEDALPD